MILIIIWISYGVFRDDYHTKAIFELFGNSFPTTKWTVIEGNENNRTNITHFPHVYCFSVMNDQKCIHNDYPNKRDLAIYVVCMRIKVIVTL